MVLMNDLVDWNLAIYVLDLSHDINLQSLDIRIDYISTWRDMASTLWTILFGVQSHNLYHVRITVRCDVLIYSLRNSFMPTPLEPDEQDVEALDEILCSPMFHQLRAVIAETTTQDDKLIGWEALLLNDFSKLLQPWSAYGVLFRFTPGPDVFSIFKQKAKDAGFDPDSATTPRPELLRFMVKVISPFLGFNLPL